MVKLPHTWINARDDCQRRHANLMIIDGQDEQDFITDKIVNLKINLVRFLIMILFLAKCLFYFNTFQFFAAFKKKKHYKKFEIKDNMCKICINLKLNTTIKDHL